MRQKALASARRCVSALVCPLQFVCREPSVRRGGAGRGDTTAWSTQRSYSVSSRTPPSDRHTLAAYQVAAFEPVPKHSCPVQDLQTRFPTLDVESVRAVVEATGPDVSTVEDNLAQLCHTPHDALVSLRARYVDVGEEIVRGVVEACDGDIVRAGAALEAMMRPTPPPIQTAQAQPERPLEMGASYGGNERRLVIFIDDSGSMAGGNLRRGHALVEEVVPMFKDVPTKVVRFGSRCETCVVSPWRRGVDLASLQHAWQGKSGRTWLWECLLAFVEHERAEGLHVLLVTDGEDTESSPPYTGIEGLTPAVQRLNELGFHGEIHLVALGNEITVKIGESYMALVAATGGVGVVLNDTAGGTMEAFAREMGQSVVVKGTAGEVDRKKRIQGYCDEVKKGKKQFVCAASALEMDADLQAAFDKAGQRFEAVQLASQARAARRHQDGGSDVSPELARLLERQKAWEHKQ
eukprot:CAMPEP_0175828140 /NCGR_PEP_ID=MMETSP0107_2-20121207/12650_1 /TAXON_ID=195067 ORGANISM="Goniomonas pacifica, Strain CCMP1869" /NCGR_SAMPLE_ID=MMETSP0107_2 /ASSEMBLY_ACC=CAM_ASM_000203 /LENGTH=463 /DNA_ID=CAMNT_0017140847 /DNA_START=134 /DNA_END=1526 /DNA_ORIENTATION=+